jgi:hypothetical protein
MKKKHFFLAFGFSFLAISPSGCPPYTAIRGMNADPAPATPATPFTPFTPLLGMASMSLEDHADSDHHDAGLPNSAGLPGLGPSAKGSHGSPDTPTPSTPKRDTKRRRVARFIAPVPCSLDSVPQGPQGPQGSEGPQGPQGPRRRMDLRVTIPWNPWNGTIAHRDHMPRPESGRLRIDDTPRDLADVGIVGIAPDPSRAFAFSGLPAPSGLPVLQVRPRVRAQKTLCNHPTKGHLFDFPTNEQSWPSLMAPHATDEFLGPLFLGPQFLGQLFRELGPMGSMDAMGPWGCYEDAGKYNRKELETLVPSATMVSAAMTVRMATSPDFLFCDESPVGSPTGSRVSAKSHSPDIRIGLSVVGTLVGA